MSQFDDYLASAGSSIATGLVNFGLNQISASNQRHWQERMWNKQNEYNSPVQQAARLRAAGLNPYQETGSVPAGSAGTGASAAPANISDPLVLLNTFAQHDNIVAQTGKTVSEQEKILRDIAALDMAYERGWIELEDYKKRIQAKWKLYEELGETEDTAIIKNSIADTDEKKTAADLNEANVTVANAQADKVESERLYTEALTDTENTLRDLRAATELAQKSYYDAMSDSAFASASKSLAEGKAVTNEAERRAYILGVGKFFGIDLLSLPPAAQNSILEIYHRGEKYWKSIGKSENSSEHYNSAIISIRHILERYMNSESAVLESEKTGYKLKFFGFGVDNSTGISHNTNK